MTDSTKEFLIGRDGAEWIQEHLTKGDVRSVISAFQQDNGLRPAFAGASPPVLGLLDAHRVARTEVFRGLLHNLRDVMLSKIDSLDQPRLLALLETTFAYISFPELRPVPIKVLKHIERIPEAVLGELAKEDLYKECPIEVKRQIWEVSEIRFRAEMAPLVSSFVSDHRAGLRKASPFFTSGVALLAVAKKRARLIKDFDLILDLIGSSSNLLRLFLTILHELFASTGDLSLASLRNQVILATRDTVAAQLSPDSAVSFISVLEQSVQQDRLEARGLLALSKELLALTEKGLDLYHLAFSLSDPFVHSVLISSVLGQITHDFVTAPRLPRDMEPLVVATRLLLLAVKSKKMSSVAPNKESRKKLAILQNRFYPTLCEIVLDHAMNEPPRPSESLRGLLAASDPARQIFFQYLMVCLHNNDLRSIDAFLPLFAEAQLDSAFVEALYKTLLGFANRDDIKQRFAVQVCHVLVPLSDRPSFFRLLFRLFNASFAHLPAAELFVLIEGSLPNAPRPLLEEIRQLVKQLKEKSEAVLELAPLLPKLTDALERKSEPKVDAQ